MKVLSIRNRKSNKEHRCLLCGAAISKCEHYIWQSGVNDNEMYSIKMHRSCIELASKLDIFDDDVEDGLSTDAFIEHVDEIYKELVSSNIYNKTTSEFKKLDFVKKHYGVLLETYILSCEEFDIMKSALGVNELERKTLPERFYRNHYHSGFYCDGIEVLKRLVYYGIMEESSNTPFCFMLTEKGIKMFRDVYSKMISSLPPRIYTVDFTLADPCEVTINKIIKNIEK